MLHILIVPIALTSILIADGQSTAFLSGNQLLGNCTSDKGHQLLCMAYLQGAADFFEEIQAARHKATCIPHGVTAGQLQSIVVKYLYSHPDKRNEVAADLVASSIAEAFNCDVTP